MATTKFTAGTKVYNFFDGRTGTIYSAFDKLRIAVVIYDDAALMVNGKPEGESASFRDLRVSK